MSLDNWLGSFKPGFNPIPFSEKLRSSLAAMVSVLLMGEVLHCVPDGGHPLILFASMAAASVLLYALPHSPMSQPWPLLVGNLLSGLLGGLCGMLIFDPVMAAACAVGISIFAMHLTRSLHPPGAATAMIMVLNSSQIEHYGWQWAVAAVTANAFLTLILAVIINNIIHLGRYPVQHSHPKTAAALSEVLAIEDIEWALGKMEGMIDVDSSDLLDIYRLASEHAGRK